jgi:hypothetical protein
VRAHASIKVEAIQGSCVMHVQVSVYPIFLAVRADRRVELTGREVKVQEKDTAGIRRVTGAHDGRLPVEQAVTDRAGAAGRRWVSAEVGQFLRDDKRYD